MLRIWNVNLSFDYHSPCINSQPSLLIIIVPYRHSIGKCFAFFFFDMHSRDKIYSLKLYHQINFTLHSKANACNIGTLFQILLLEHMEKKHLPIDSMSHSHNSVACLFNKLQKITCALVLRIFLCICICILTPLNIVNFQAGVLLC
jgi:hypothetical protein